jgi:hypothetical protein
MLTHPQRLLLFASSLLCAGSALCTSPEELELHWPDGSLRARYGVDAAGRRSGPYLEYHQGGRLKVKTRYRADRIEGKYETFYENGERELRASYKQGLLHGKYEEFEEDGELLVRGKYDNGERDGEFNWFRDSAVASVQIWAGGQLEELDGLVPYPRPRATLAATLEEIYDPARTEVGPILAREARAGEPSADADLSPEEREQQGAERAAALRRLMAYRYLCGLPWKDMRLDEDYNYHASFAARLLVLVGRLDHTPENPGMPEDEYRRGYKGTSSSNLSLGSNLPGSIDGYMDDSDPSNIDRVGHRLWCLNPAMLRTGFGRRGSFSAMWSFDSSRSKVPKISYVAYPAPGYFPVEYFGSRHAWSVQLLGSGLPAARLEDLTVEVFEVDEEFRRAEQPLALDHLGVRGSAVIFRPVGVQTVAGQRYWVQLKGKGGKSLEYFVEFVGELQSEE